MAVLERSALAESPLADLHAIAGELGIDGFRRLRREELIDAIVARQAGDDGARTEEPATGAERPRRRRGGRGRGRDRDSDRAEAAPKAEAQPKAEQAPEKPAREKREEVERIATGVVELLPNGSGFIRVNAPDASDGDVYVSAAQVRRCELVDGDTVSGPVRTPRRSERYPSLVRIDTINSRPADEVADGVRFDELPATFPDERIALGSEDPTVKAIEWLTPFGKGSRVTIAGAARTGKTEALRRIAERLAAVDGLELSLVLTGVRPEELGAWSEGPVKPAVAVSFAGTPDAQAGAVERTIDQAKRVAARGGDAVVLLDTLEGLTPHQARKTIAAARNVVGGGSLTVIATASAPIGGETTVVALDAELAGSHRFPAIDLLSSGTIRPELLVGDAGAEAIAEARREAALD